MLTGKMVTSPLATAARSEFGMASFSERERGVSHGRRSRQNGDA